MACTSLSYFSFDLFANKNPLLIHHHLPSSYRADYYVNGTSSCNDSIPIIALYKQVQDPYSNEIWAKVSVHSRNDYSEENQQKLVEELLNQMKATFTVRFF
jgi:hypothetical protein